MRRLPWIAAIVLLFCTGCPSDGEKREQAPDAAPAEQAPSAAVQAEAPSTEPVRVEVWHDVVCPWCRVAVHNLDAALDQWKGRPVEVIYRPFLLSPNMPPEGRTAQEQFGPNLERIEASQNRVAAIGAQYGVRFDFGKIERIPPTVAAHALIDWAPKEKKTEVVEALGRAHFEEGRFVGDPAVLAQIAASVGLDPEAARAAVTDPARLERIRAEAADAREAGVSSVPAIDVDGRRLQGAQSPEVIRAAIEEAAAK